MLRNPRQARIPSVSGSNTGGLPSALRRVPPRRKTSRSAERFHRQSETYQVTISGKPPEQLAGSYRSHHQMRQNLKLGEFFDFPKLFPLSCHLRSNPIDMGA